MTTIKSKVLIALLDLEVMFGIIFTAMYIRKYNEPKPVEKII